MKRSLYILLLVVMFPYVSPAQVTPNNKKLQAVRDNVNQSTQDSTRSNKSTSNSKLKNKSAKITDYKIVSFNNDTTYVDTTLSIKKDYKYNYLRKDNFNLIAFSNLGQTYNTLSKDFQSNSLLPNFAARAKHFNYYEIEDVNYFNVPTPLTELFFKTAFEQGQLSDAFFTVNTSKQFNFSLGYKGLRSLGKYQHIITSTGNFLFTTNYKTKNNRYNARAHVAMQDIFNEENGGLTDESVINFESGSKEFLDRSVFDVNFEDAENILIGKRYYLDQSYAIIKQKDSITNNELNVTNSISLKSKYYQFNQTSRNTYFGDAFKSSNLFDKVTLEEFNTSLGAEYKNKTIGTLGLALNYADFNYGYDAVVELNGNQIINRIKGNAVSLSANYKKAFGNKVDLQANLGSIISGDIEGNYLSAQVNYKLNDNNNIQLNVNSNSSAPNYNFQLYQSDYLNYNWQNNLKNINLNQLSAKIESNILNVSIDYTTINNFVSFKINTDNEVKPYQNDKTINYLRFKINKEINFHNFSLDNTVMYQTVDDANNTFNVPQLITRNTLYYSNHLFKKALYLQTGVTLNYFTKYYMDGYDPLLSEFYTQTEKEFGGFPRLDFFVNAKVRQTRIYLKAEHFNSSFTGYNFYSAPNNPYRDFTVRFGLVWNFFM